MWKLIWCLCEKIFNSNKNLDHIHIPNPIQNQIHDQDNAAFIFIEY